jgi:alkanesulfonate monooxygenase SsuD/methylene tetrahydromethanopterin reductase-like flavin-dependent oxidoreductase (luciferase family)
VRLAATLIGQDSTVTTVGAVFLPQFPPERLRAVARAADDAGLAELWLWEDCFREGAIATAAAALAWTSRVRLGIGLLPVPLRNVAITAMEAATLHRLFPDRLLLGVGHGVQDWMQQVGAQVESPVTLLREHLTALRTLLAGEEVTTAGRYVHLDRVALDWPPAAAVPVLAGAEGPRTLRTAGELADGTILTGGTTPDGVRRARSLLDEGRAVGGRTGPHPVTVYVFAATGPDAVNRLRAAQQRWGLAPSAETGLSGDADAIAEGVTRWAAAGADSIVLQPTDDEPDPEGFMRLAADVGRLLR